GLLVEGSSWLAASAGADAPSDSNSGSLGSSSLGPSMHRTAGGASPAAASASRSAQSRSTADCNWADASTPTVGTRPRLAATTRLYARGRCRLLRPRGCASPGGSDDPGDGDGRQRPVADAGS